ncbi:MAG: proton-conducting transporter membrane subunit, partial [Chromatiaceae bacterium]
MIDPLSPSIALPLLGAVLATALPARAAWMGLATAAATTGTTLALALKVWAEGTQRLALGGWGVPLGVALQADGLSAALLTMANLVALGISLYALRYFAQGRLERHFWPLWLLLWAALNGLLLAADLFNLYVTLELLGLSAAALGALTGTREAVAANLRYLLVGLLGSMTYLLGVALLYTGLGTLDLQLAAAALGPGPLAGTAFALMVGGLLLKAALFPLHFWLPPAHASAPAPVSAALSALVVKAAFDLVLRLWLDLFGATVTLGAGTLLGVLGAGAVLWGSWRAFRAERLKLLAAYSTVAQMGYLFLFFPLLAAVADPAARADLIAAAVLLALTHGFAKAGLFLSAGLLQKAAGHDRIAELGPATQALPGVTLAVALAGVALIGLPPSGTFNAKWILLSQAIDSGQWWWVPVIMTGTLLAAAYIFRVLAGAFDPGPRHGEAQTAALQAQAGLAEMGTAIQLPALALGLIAMVVLGLGSAPLWGLLTGAATVGGTGP